MKKTTKFLLMAAFSFFIVGAAFGVVSICLGFRPDEFRAAAEDGRLRFPGSAKWTGNIRGWVSDLTTDCYDFEETYTDVEALDLEVGAADCRLILYEGDTWKVAGYQVPSRFKCRQSGKTLKIDCSKNGWGFLNFGMTNTELAIYIPRSQALRTVKLDVGVGSLETEDGVLKCDKLELDCGVGECTVRADIGQKGDIDGGVGNITLTLIGKEQDFNYDIDYGVGSVEVGKSSYSGLGGDRKIDNDADRDLEIDCGVGNIVIDFETEEEVQGT